MLMIDDQWCFEIPDWPEVISRPDLLTGYRGFSSFRCCFWHSIYDCPDRSREKNHDKQNRGGYPFSPFVMLNSLRTRLASFLCLFTLATTASTVERPNILFIFLDDYGWKDAGFMGSDFYETPNIDRLAAEGMIFTDAYSSAANCAPARACLLSGQYTPRHKIFNVGTSPRGKAQHRRLEHIAGTATLDPKIKTWAHCLQDAGYRTATMGKWHLSNDPLPYGFDINVGARIREARPAAITHRIRRLQACRMCPRTNISPPPSAIAPSTSFGRTRNVNGRFISRFLRFTPRSMRTRDWWPTRSQATWQTPQPRRHGHDGPVRR